MMTRMFRMFAVLPMLLLAACSLSSPSANFYTLSSTATPVAVDSKLSVALTLTEFPDALDRPQIMLRTGENRLEIQELDRWAGPLDRQFLLVLTENLVNLTGSQRIAPEPWELGSPPERRLSLAILRFDGDPGGSAQLRVRWALTDAEGKLLLTRTSAFEEPAGADIDSLVAAQSRLVERLAQEIVEDLGRN